jgi:hypothetical protein
LAEAARDPLVASLFDLHAIDAPKPAQLIAASRLVRRSASSTTAHEDVVCEICGTPAGARHSHLVDIATRGLVCACRPCSAVLGHGKYARVPDRVARVSAADATDAWWLTLGVPTGLAFFVARSDGSATAHYPGPSGVTDGVVPAGAWLPEMEPHAEALLVDRADGAREHWIVGVDRCYELVAEVRRTWRGFTGGGAVRDVRRRFFASLAAEARR